MRKIEPFDGGIIVVDKPAGWTSHDVVNRVRRLYDTRQVGHTGTLDPLATGVLAVLVGRAVKASEYLSAHDKCYEARFRLGVVSDTGDITGSLTETGAPIPPADAVLAAARACMSSASSMSSVKLSAIVKQPETVRRSAVMTAPQPSARPMSSMTVRT